jgi:crotonobetainyl-CoA:carnitine CoA-transferase CaiB-like acyl-CoA transferase
LSLESPRPLAGLKVIERADGVAASYAGRLLSVMGADVTMVEAPGGSALRQELPFLTRVPDLSAVFAYLAAGKKSVICDTATAEGRSAFAGFLQGADILINDTPVRQRPEFALEPDRIMGQHPNLVYLSVLPFGAAGPKADWKAHEINVFHASGEGNMLPNGLSIELFPERPPLKIYGHFASMQAGTVAALGVLSAIWARPELGGQFVDISIQDSALAVGAFAVQRYGDGCIEDRRTRSFRYGGVLECVDGYVELLTLEQRQWDGLVELMGKPAWALDEALADPLERGRRGSEINTHIRIWAKRQRAAELVSQGQALGVPIAKYNTPSEVLSDPQMRSRRLFSKVEIDDIGGCDLLSAPFHFEGAPLALRSGPPRLGQHGNLVSGGGSNGQNQIAARQSKVDKSQNEAS